MHLFAEYQTQIDKLQLSKWQIMYKFVYINDYCLMSFRMHVKVKFRSIDVLRWNSYQAYFQGLMATALWKFEIIQRKKNHILHHTQKSVV